ncbi:MAG: hypothetical protein N2449_03245 [Bacteroidales bacterium]|nr:hypothetical protein [Bacteroidales bacterium]
MKTTFLVLALTLINSWLIAQFDIKYLDKCGYLKITAGNIMSNDDMKRTDESGLFAKNGYFIGFDYNHIITHGFGIGINIQIDRYNFNKEAFAQFALADDYKVKGRYASTRWGLNIVQNIPIVVSENNFLINIYGEANAGLRGFSIPAIDLYYSELNNKWVEVNYRTRMNTMGYLGFSAGLQFIIADFLGINISYNEVLRSRHSIRYSIRLTDAFEQVEEKESYLHNYLDSRSLQFGVFFLFGKY